MRPLDGITVVSLEHAIAAPFASRQLADLLERLQEGQGRREGLGRGAALADRQQLDAKR